MADVFGVQKTLQAFSRRQATQNVFFLLSIEIRLAAHSFQLLLPPAFFVLVGGVHELGAQGAAIGLAQGIEQFAQRHAVFAEEGVARVKHGFLIGIAKPVKRGVQVGDVRALGALERV